MRIRKEISKWNAVMFLKVTAVILLLFNLFYLSAAYMDHSIADINPWNWLMMCVLYPILLSSILNNGFRKGTLYINDYHTIADFNTKLKTKILSENMEIELTNAEYTIYKPKNWFFKMFKAWHGSEKLKAHWGDEICIEGSLKKINILEEILTWNKDFK